MTEIRLPYPVFVDIQAQLDKTGVERHEHESMMEIDTPLRFVTNRFETHSVTDAHVREANRILQSYRVLRAASEAASLMGNPDLYGTSRRTLQKYEDRFPSLLEIFGPREQPVRPNEP